MTSGRSELDDIELDDIELDAEARALLDALRAEEDLPQVVHDRVWARLDRQIVRERARSIGGWLVGGLAAAAVLALVWVGGRTIARDDDDATSSMQAPFEKLDDETGRRASSRRPSPARAVDLEEIEPDASASVPVEDEASDPEPMEEDVSPSHARENPDPRSERPRAPARRGSRPRPEPADSADAPDADPLAEEMALLKQAKLALSRGEPRRALRWLDQHAERFEHGVLVQERQALRVVALCDAGETDRGRAAAATFLREHPRAALAERVRAACSE